MNKVILRRGKEESLNRFHPWIFSGAIHHTEITPREGEAGSASLEEGDIVEVLASDGRFLAIGHWQIGSIAVRVLTFKRQPINQAFWQKRLAAALDVRCAIGVSEMENGKENSYGSTFKKAQTIRLPPTSMRKMWRGSKWS